MIMWIVFGAKCFAHIYAVSGAVDVVSGAILGLTANRWLILLMSQLILLLLGMFMDPMGILVIVCPVFLPIMTSLGFDLIWYGILFTINMEIGFVTPPFGFNLFYMKPLAEPYGITMGAIYKSIIPFVLLGMVGLGLVIAFPQLALWLPSAMISR